MSHIKNLGHRGLSSVTKGSYGFVPLMSECELLTHISLLRLSECIHWSSSVTQVDTVYVRACVRACMRTHVCVCVYEVYPIFQTGASAHLRLNIVDICRFWSGQRCLKSNQSNNEHGKQWVRYTRAVTAVKSCTQNT